jgi:ring-1,2-phenylacetyl-CoA epoxidase subunit PaaD
LTKFFETHIGTNFDEMKETTTQDSIKTVWSILHKVYDPEIPVLSVVDLGIIREISCTPSATSLNNNVWQVVITPTYSGCPAIDTMAMYIKLALIENGYSPVVITTILLPAWTTEWISAEGKKKLKAYGIAPPTSVNVEKHNQAITCPQCHASHTLLLSQFGSTACKALYQCVDCKEPFEYFKCH